MDKFYEKLNIPNNCLVDQTVFKKEFLSNADLLSSDKKIINEHIKKVVWKYCLKPDTINVQPYKSEERDYLEIEVIEVQLNEISKIKRIAEIVMRSIPYPILLVLTSGSKIQLVIGDMRKNLSDSSKVTVDDFIYSDWIDLQDIDDYSAKLFNDLNIKNLSYTNFYEMYKDITEKVNLYNISKTKGEIIETKVGVSNSDIRDYYNRINEIEEEINSIEKHLNKNSPVSDRVEASIKIKQLKDEKDNLLKKI